MNIYVARHGRTQMNELGVVNGEVDEPIIGIGIEQAKVLANQIPNTVTQIYCSPLIRAVQTSEIISEATGLPISVNDNLREVSMGDLSGKAWEDMPDGQTLKRKHRSVSFDYREHGGESVDDARKRLMSAISEIQQAHEDHEALIITHGGIIRILQFFTDGSTNPDRLSNAEIIAIDTRRFLG